MERKDNPQPQKLVNIDEVIDQARDYGLKTNAPVRGDQERQQWNELLTELRREVVDNTARLLIQYSSVERPKALDVVMNALLEFQHGSSIGEQINFLTDTLLKTAEIAASSKQD